MSASYPAPSDRPSGGGSGKGGRKAEAGGPARVPRPTAAERRALAALADLSRRFEPLVAELADIHAGLAQPPEAELEAMGEGARPPSIAFHLFGSIECMLEDAARPLAEALAADAATTPASLLADWRRFRVDERRLLQRLASRLGPNGAGSARESKR